MLLKLSDPVAECLRRAEECGRLSKTAIDAASIDHFLKMEQRWLFLSRSHQFNERVNRFTGNLGSGRPAGRSLGLASDARARGANCGGLILPAVGGSPSAGFQTLLR
jgi:hypothetical protein